MSRVSSQQPLLPSVLDRLIDTEPDVSSEPAWRQTQSLREFEASVLRDLEVLLNTRQARPELARERGELSQSLLTFGLPDFSSIGIGHQTEREQLRQVIDETIRRFEPRLKQVSITLREPENALDSTLRLSIDALLWIDPQPEPISFDTIVRPSSGQCTVKSR
ncbi:MAG TPA: type VI secretion system baseplate subunit TssE [Pirellulales bacterium]